MTFEMILEDAKLMANICSIISSIVAESSVNIAEDGIRIKAFDATRISMIDFFLKKEAFKKYDVKETAILGLSLETLNTILKTARANENLRMALDDKTKRFVIEFIGKNQQRKFALSLIDIPEEGNIPDSIHIDFDTNFEVKASFIQQVLKDAEMVSDYLRIKAKEDGIYFGAESDTKEMDTFIEPKSEEMETSAFQVAGESEAVYSLDFLSNFLKGIRSSDYVKLSYNQEQPIRIVYELEDKGHLIYFVAPRIEESEEIED
ncbi:MAG: proliferating cell nuclear antigen (pcna) [Candidatus Heimdallarchaeota archaeon]|jgi:proliferating cell nuclear antigen|nr:proliferating cell nuclear antigen (pcna) [Candidatus Heimdallarchaeota archaeon]MCK4253395.1 proliferating cell nuclear antigen (pcna) [Candidatus Heimdallarchaeota archaeon]